MSLTHRTIPGINSLVAFEAAARLGSLSKAAAELGTSQPVISRHVARIEAQFAARLFHRTGAGVRPTDAGSHYQQAVARSLDILQAAGAEVADWSRSEQLVIVSTNETSPLFLIPCYAALCEALGQQAGIRILNDFRLNIPSPSPDPVADVVLTWDTSGFTTEERVVALKEAVRPLCSPDYAAAHAHILNGPVSGWEELIFLNLDLPLLGFSSWRDWFAAAGWPKAPPRFLDFNSYAYVLEAATVGRGIALGWKGYIERYLDDGLLVELADGYVETKNTYYCVLTEKGRRNPLSRKCLEFFEQSAMSGCWPDRLERSRTS